MDDSGAYHDDRWLEARMLADRAKRTMNAWASAKTNMEADARLAFDAYAEESAEHRKTALALCRLVTEMCSGDSVRMEAAIRLAARRAVEIDMVGYLPEKVLTTLENER